MKVCRILVILCIIASLFPSVVSASEELYSKSFSNFSVTIEKTPETKEDISNILITASWNTSIRQISGIVVTPSDVGSVYRQNFEVWESGNSSKEISLLVPSSYFSQMSRGSLRIDFLRGNSPNYYISKTLDLRIKDGEISGTSDESIYNRLPIESPRIVTSSGRTSISFKYESAENKLNVNVSAEVRNNRPYFSVTSNASNRKSSLSYIEFVIYERIYTPKGKVTITNYRLSKGFEQNRVWDNNLSFNTSDSGFYSFNKSLRETTDAIVAVILYDETGNMLSYVPFSVKSQRPERLDLIPSELVKSDKLGKSWQLWDFILNGS